jgi:hypothetical protein
MKQGNVSLLITTRGEKGSAKMWHKMHCMGNEFSLPRSRECKKKHRLKKRAKRAISLATIATVEANSQPPVCPHVALINLEIVLNNYLRHWYLNQGKYGSKTIF